MSETRIPVTSAAHAIAGALVRHAVTVAGTGLVARGYIDADMNRSLAGVIAHYALGAALTIGAAAWAAVWARITHARWVQAWSARRGRSADPKPATRPHISLSSVIGRSRIRLPVAL